MGSVWAMVVVEGDPASDASLCLRPGFPIGQVDAFILQGPPKALDEDLVETAPLSIHRDPGADSFEPVGPGEGRELGALIGVQDLGRAEPLDRLVHRLDAEVRLQRV